MAFALIIYKKVTDVIKSGLIFYELCIMVQKTRFNHINPI